MRLERLQLAGFKSFSDRSELAFDRGVTAIVGPNGCGKSNVADAITWVMGEQSAKSLRGERMEDVIFSGSDARKPTASAEVRLRFSGVLKSVTAPVFSDAGVGQGHGEGRAEAHGHGHQRADGSSCGRLHEPIVTGMSRTEAEELIRSVARDVEVTRRLYRSGESEYLIDGEVCRLRDVHELLMDTGLGAKAYAIIEQGKIEMILSSRPIDRRQLIEEAAGVTKYRSRRRTAALKLEAAQQNLARIDDIVFEVEKQRGTLKRQAAKARRHQKLRDALRRWEKVLFARKYRQLAETIGSARGRLAEAREREAAAGARLAEVEADLERVRIELVEAESHAAERREAAHASELAINRQQQQIAFDREHVQTLGARVTSVAAELEAVGVRREPARLALAARREAAVDAEAERDGAAGRLTADADAYESAHRNIEGLEADVEAARSDVFSALNSATALRHALEHAAAARDRVAATLSKLDVEASDVRIEADRVQADHVAAEVALRLAQEAIEVTRVARAARESELAITRIDHERCARSIRAGEQDLAGIEARLKSLEELDAARAGFGDAARMVLAQANGKVGQLGAVADYLEVETGYERAVEACLADLLQHVVVEHPEQAVAGFELVREAGAGRCGFLVTSLAPMGSAAAGRTETTPSDGLVALSSVVRVRGPFAEAIRQSMGDAWIADSYERAAQAARGTEWPVVTLAGDLFHAPHLVTGGGREEARGILATKREIKELRDRLETQRAGLFRLAEEASGLEAAIAHASNAIAALHAEHHRQEKAIVGHDLQLLRAVEEALRLAQKGEQLARERRQAEEERDALVRRQEEARASIARLEDEQRAADEQLTAAQRRLLETRESVEEMGRLIAEARAACAVLVERAAALAAEVQRMEEAGAELEARVAALATEHDQIRHRVSELCDAIAAGETRLDAAVRAIDTLRLEVQAADDAVADFRGKVDQHDASIREARRALEAIRVIVSGLEIARARAESDLSHLAASCLETVQATLDEVLADVEQLERDGQATPDARVICADEGDDAAEDVDAEMDGLRAESETAAVPPRPDLGEPGAAVLAAEQHTLSAEDAIGRLREKIDRLGPVNMMAIEQFEELETRHVFLTAQCRDLTESIAQTSQAISRIDETTRLRFAEAFAAINRHFKDAFRTLFGGGHAGLTLLDEGDPLESGIEIIAQPPGKRLQSVQLLSGGEKALTAISLMFGLFRHKPSPFCLLDEIDAPLDDANIGRFVEMLRGMQHQTQFIVITHNRKTMEIADRLYGVTMEEPGVSKLISVQLN